MALLKIIFSKKTNLKRVCKPFRVHVVDLYCIIICKVLQSVSNFFLDYFKGNAGQIWRRGKFYLFLWPGNKFIKQVLYKYD